MESWVFAVGKWDYSFDSGLRNRVFVSFLILELKFDRFFMYICRIMVTIHNKRIRGTWFAFLSNNLLYRTIISNVNGAWMQIFYCGFSFANTDDSQGSRERKRAIFIPTAQKYSDIYLQFCIWDDYLLFFNYIAWNFHTLTRETIHLLKIEFGWMLN